MDVKHFEDCEQLFISIGRRYLIEALLQFFGMDTVDGTPERNDPLLRSDASCEEQKTYIEEPLGNFIDNYILENLSEDDSDDDSAGEDRVMNYSINLLRSFMILLDYKDAVATGNENHLTIIQKQMIPYFFCVSYNAYAIEMLISTMQNEITLSPAKAHKCKWGALVNWNGGKNKNIEIDLLQ